MKNKKFKYSLACSLVSFALLSQQQNNVQANSVTMTKDDNLITFTLNTDQDNTVWKWEGGADLLKSRLQHGDEEFDKAENSGGRVRRSLTTPKWFIDGSVIYDGDSIEINKSSFRNFNPNDYISNTGNRAEMRYYEGGELGYIDVEEENSLNKITGGLKDYKDSKKARRIVFTGNDGATLLLKDTIIEEKRVIDGVLRSVAPVEFNSNITVDGENIQLSNGKTQKQGLWGGDITVAEGKEIDWKASVVGDIEKTGKGLVNFKNDAIEFLSKEAKLGGKVNSSIIWQNLNMGFLSPSSTNPKPDFLTEDLNVSSNLYLLEGDAIITREAGKEHTKAFHYAMVKNGANLTFNYENGSADSVASTTTSRGSNTVGHIAFGGGGGTVNLGGGTHTQAGDIVTYGGKGKIENGTLVLKNKNEGGLMMPYPFLNKADSFSGELDVKGLVVDREDKSRPNTDFILSGGGKITAGSADFDKNNPTGLYIKSNSSLVLQGYQKEQLSKEEIERYSSEDRRNAITEASGGGYLPFLGFYYDTNEDVAKLIENRNYEIDYVNLENDATLKVGHGAIAKIKEINGGEINLGVSNASSLYIRTTENGNGDISENNGYFDIGDATGVITALDSVRIGKDNPLYNPINNPTGEDRKKFAMNTTIKNAQSLNIGNIDFTGRLINSENTNVSLGDTSKWFLNNENLTVSNLNAGGIDSHIYLTATEAESETNANGFNTLRVNGTLGGSGTIHLKTNVEAGQGDKISVSNANGRVKLEVRNQGREPTREHLSLPLVESDNVVESDEAFSLVGGHLDLGAFRYTLKHDKNEAATNAPKSVFKLFNKTADDLNKQDEANRIAEEERRRQEEERRAAEEAERQKEEALRKAEEERRKAEEAERERQRLEEEKRNAEERQKEEERKRAEEEARRLAELEKANKLKDDAERLAEEARKKFEEASASENKDRERELVNEGNRLIEEGKDKNNQGNQILEDLKITIDRNPNFPEYVFKEDSEKPVEPVEPEKPIDNSGNGDKDKPKEDDKPVKQSEAMSGISNIAVSDFKVGSDIVLQNSQRVGRLFLVDTESDVSKVWTETQKQDHKIGEGSKGYNRDYDVDVTYMEIGARTAKNDEGLLGGVILSQTNANSYFDKDGTGKITHHQGTVFLKVESDDGYFAIADASYGRSQNKVSLSRQNENGKEIKAKFNRNTMSAGVNVGKTTNVYGMDLTGMAGLHYHHIGSANYELDKAKVETESVGVMSYNVGVGVSKTIKVDEFEIKPRASVSYFTTGNKTFDEVVKVNGIGFKQQLSDGLNYEVGLGVKIKDAWRAEVNGGYVKSKNSSSSKQFGVKVGYEF